MAGATRRTLFDRVLFDMNTQCDFLLPKGALPVANRTEILPNIRKIMNWGRNGRTPVISTLESHRPGETPKGLPTYCVDRTKGQRKIPFTLMPRRILLHGDNTLDLPFEPFNRYQQIIFTKRDCDCLSNPKVDRLINALRTKCFIVFGVLAEQCIKVAVMGLLARKLQIIVVADACGYWYSAEAELAFRQMDAKGAIVATTEELLSGAAEARVDEERKPIVKDAPESSGPGKDNGRDQGLWMTRDREHSRAGNNGRTRTAQQGQPHSDSAGPLDDPRRNVRSPLKNHAEHPRDLA